MIQIDWSKAPEDANWWAMDKNGLCYFYKEKPFIEHNYLMWDSYEKKWVDANAIQYNLSEIDWRNSLTRRPAEQKQKTMLQIDWSKAPKWANYWAMDANGICFFFQFEPKILKKYDGWTAQKTDWELDTNSQSYNLSGIDWRNSLTRRPSA